jgi:hypothetical protein
MYKTIRSISVLSLCNFKAIPLFNKNYITFPVPIAGVRLVLAQESYAPTGVIYIIIPDAASVIISMAEK